MLGRADIVDRNGMVLATTVPTASLYANPRQVRAPHSLAERLAATLPGLDAEEMARRETLDETGCAVSRLEEVMSFYSSPGGSSQHVTLFCGEVSTEGAGGHFGLADEDEDIRAFVKTADEAIAMADSGAIDNAVSILGLQWLARNRDALRARWT